MRQIFKVKCVHCGEEVERSIPRKDAACFGCKQDRVTGYALKYRKEALPLKKK
jgi:hypothetical protein